MERLREEQFSCEEFDELLSASTYISMMLRVYILIVVKLTHAKSSNRIRHMIDYL